MNSYCFIVKALGLSSATLRLPRLKGQFPRYLFYVDSIFVFAF
jgi:hypothetical protein